MRSHVNLFDYRFILCIVLSSIKSGQNGRVHLPSTDQTDRVEKYQIALAEKRSSSNALVRRLRPEKNHPNQTTGIRQIDHHKEYQLPVLRQKGNSSLKRCDCQCHKDSNYFHNTWDETQASNEPDEITFDYALEHADRWTLRMAESRLSELKQKLQKAKNQYNSDVFHDINKSAGDVVDEVERTYNQVCEKLDKFYDIPLMPDDYQGHEEYLRLQQENWNEEDHEVHEKMYKHYKMMQTG